MPSAPLPPTGRETGIDVGLKGFLVPADGKSVENPRHYRRAEKQLAKAQRQVSRRTKGSTRRTKGSTRRTKGSTRRTKAVTWLAKEHQHVRRQRTDFHHKTALALLRTCDTSSLED